MKTTIVSLGGSLIVPDKIDTNFIDEFRKTIKKFTSQGNKFIIVCGGGKIARNYQKAATEICSQSNENLDWLGIHATKMNAWFMKAIFGNDAENMIIEDPMKKVKFSRKILIAGGWKPGWSTDYDAVLLAKKFKAKEVINLSSADHVYDSDPRKNRNAKKLEKISWKEYRKISGDKWKAGLSLPFDPVASKEAEKLGIKVHIIGKDLDNFEDVLNEKKFEGTLIE
jgi:uridylate kinase